MGAFDISTSVAYNQKPILSQHKVFRDRKAPVGCKGIARVESEGDVGQPFRLGFGNQQVSLGHRKSWYPFPFRKLSQSARDIKINSLS